MRKRKMQKQAPKVPDVPAESKIDLPKTEFIPHRLDPLLSMSEAGRLIGRSHTTIARWIECGIIEPVRGQGMRVRVRKSDLIAVSGVAAFARKSPYLYLMESELPDGYEYDSDSMPAIRNIDQIEYYPVHLNWFKDDDSKASADSESSATTSGS